MANPNPSPDTQWQPGQSGNPNGRPEGAVSIKAELRRLLELTLKNEPNFLTEECENMPVGRKVALNLLSKAIVDGDLKAIQMALEHIDGKPSQDVTSAGKALQGTTIVVGSQGDKELLEGI
jgi:hypothetical protein